MCPTRPDTHIEPSANQRYKSSKIDLFSATPSLSVPFVTLVDRIEVRHPGRAPGVPATVRLRPSDENSAQKRLEKVKEKIQEAKVVQLIKCL